MPSPATFDIAALVAPIDAESPVGKYLRESDPADKELWTAARDARFAAAKAEEKNRELDAYSDEEMDGMPEEDRQRPSVDWETVLERCEVILRDHSKDLWVAAWLIEASVRINGFAGMRDACLVVDGLVQDYWGSIHPRPDEDYEEDETVTVSHLASLNGTGERGALIAPLESLALVPGYDELNFTAHRDARESSVSRVSEADFAAAVSRANVDGLQTLRDDVAEASAAFEQMTTTLMDKAGSTIAPPSSLISQTLEEIGDLVSELTADRLGDGSPADDDEPGSASDGDAASVGAGNSAGGVSISNAAITNRNEAFDSLLKVSEFFRRTEPHSPLSAMLKHAVRLGRMDVRDLYKELIDDEDVLRRLSERTGIQFADDDNDDED